MIPWNGEGFLGAKAGHHIVQRASAEKTGGGGRLISKTRDGKPASNGV